MRTVTALFDSRTQAEAARDELCASSAAPDRVNIIDQKSEGFSNDAYSNRENRGFWGAIKDTFLPDEDRVTYEEGVRRGSYLLTAQVDEDNVDQAVAILERGSVDLDQRSKEWRSQGWSGYNANDFGDRAIRNDEQTIQLAEEQIAIGKREVERGGVKVRSYVTETPVREEVSLREEHVNVERRPVDQPLSARDGDNSALFQEREIEMRETSEEAVVSKSARVTEEIGISKTADTRTEVIEDTVRKTEVDIDDGTRSATRTTTDIDYDTNRKL